ncbi:dephospho-CoA kinase [Hoylesella loescheii]|uniref:Dephospho-CoA kinase n=1 Tax=Hoylesella loescheii DSM 19665 = JCM 12249 = ATCC 15930 TaxID=1122985 RepID=A0A069QGL9_HOYLO|nr:dephospho-CoA kinase [Hoylesella loescheii]KDR51945.1 dephospho-CoA kinase [Hoylesella loescheii DSM 19665 = JCM 12249 = ATCC 15930]
MSSHSISPNLRIALTGGIGSGKSYVAQLLRARGIEVFDCDASAKRLLRSSEPLMQSMRQLVGNHLYVDGRLQKQVLAAYLLASDENKQRINALVHPAVARDFEQSGYQWLESAIFFESGFDARVKIDKVVCVTAPLEVRIQRVMQRDALDRQKALGWIECQWPQERIRAMSHFEIVNDGVQDVSQQLNELLIQLTNA